MTVLGVYLDIRRVRLGEVSFLKVIFWAWRQALKVVGLRLDLFRNLLMAHFENEVHVGLFYNFLEF